MIQSPWVTFTCSADSEKFKGKKCEIDKLNVKMSVNKNINIDYNKYQKVPSDTQFELNSNKFMSSNVSPIVFCFYLIMYAHFKCFAGIN